MIGGVVWARAIGSVCSILSCGDPVEEKFEASTDLLNNVMREARVPPRLCEYLREAKQHNANSQFRVLAQRFSPQLRGYLLIHMSERWISNVAYFSEAPHSMIIDVAVVVDNHFFAQRDMLNGISHCLCTVERGTLDYGPSIMTNGSVFQKDMIIAYVALHDVRRAVSGTYCQILVLDKPPLDDIVSKYPEFGQELDEITSALGSRSSASSGRSLSVARPEGCPSGGWPSKGQPRRPPGRPWRCAPPA